MLSLYDSAALRGALTLPLRANIQALLHKRIGQVFEDGLENHTHLVVVFADDTEAALMEEIGFSPLRNETGGYGSAEFHPSFDIVHNHSGLYEMVYCVGNDGFAFVLLIEDSDDPAWPSLRDMCHAACGH